jgi:transposase-like protein
VRWYCRYGISYRDLEEMVGERGVAVDFTTLYRWVQHYAPELEKRTCGSCRLPKPSVGAIACEVLVRILGVVQCGRRF